MCQNETLDSTLTSQRPLLDVYTWKMSFTSTSRQQIYIKNMSLRCLKRRTITPQTFYGHLSDLWAHRMLLRPNNLKNTSCRGAGPLYASAKFKEQPQHHYSIILCFNEMYVLNSSIKSKVIISKYIYMYVYCNLEWRWKVAVYVLFKHSIYLNWNRQYHAEVEYYIHSLTNSDSLL